MPWDWPAVVPASSIASIVAALRIFMDRFPLGSPARYFHCGAGPSICPALTDPGDSAGTADDESEHRTAPRRQKAPPGDQGRFPSGCDKGQAKIRPKI